MVAFSLIVCADSNAREIDYDHKKVQLVMLEIAINVVKLATRREIIAAVEAQNSLELSIEEIQRRDKRWMSSFKSHPFKLALQENKPGTILKSMVLRNRAIYSEAFLTDNQGANVGAYPATTDYWQGDEDKFIIAFNDGKGQLLITPVEFDKSSNTYAAQIASPVVDRNGVTIGVLFVGIKLSYAKVR